MAQTDDWGGVLVAEPERDDWGGIAAPAPKTDDWGGIEVEEAPSETIPAGHPDRAEEIASAGLNELLTSSTPGTGELQQFLSKPVSPDAMQPSNQPITPVEMTPLGAGVRAAAESFVPTTAGAAAGGAVMSLAQNPLIKIGGALAAGVGASMAFSKAQEELQKLGESEFETQARRAELAATSKDFPIASTVGALAPQLVAFRPSLALNLANRAINSGIAAGTEIGVNAATGQPITLQSVLTNAGVAALLDKPTAVGRSFGFHEGGKLTESDPSIELANLQRDIANQAKPYEQAPRQPIGEVELDGIVRSREDWKQRYAQATPEEQPAIQANIDELNAQLLNFDRAAVGASVERVTAPSRRTAEGEPPVSPGTEQAPPAEVSTAQPLRPATAAGETTPAAGPESPVPRPAGEVAPSPLAEVATPENIVKPSAETRSQKPVPAPSTAEQALGPDVAAGKSWKQQALPEELRTSPELESALRGAETPEGRRAPMRELDTAAGGALGFGGGGKPVVKPAGVTPKNDPAFIRVESAPQRLFKGLLTDGSADVLAKSKNKIGQLLSKQIRKHVDVEQELTGKFTAELDRATKGMSKGDVAKATAELDPYLAAKENGRPLPPLSKNAQSLLTAWENIAEQTGLLSEAHGVQVFDPTTGGYRPMHRIGRAYVPRVFKPEVQKVLTDPRRDPKLFNDLATALAAHRGVTLDAAAAELRGVAGRFQASDFMGNLEMARTGQLPEIFYDYNLGNIASRYIQSYSERMAQIISFGQRLGPREAPLRENLWDVAMKEAEDSYTQQWIRSAEDQSVNLRAAGGPAKLAQQGQTLASGLLLSSPTTSVIRNTLSGLTATTELLGVRRSMANLVKAATDAQTKLDAREIGAVRENLGDFLHADQLGKTRADDLIRGVVDTTLKYSGYNGSEGFVRTHAAATASQFAKDGVAAIAKNPASGAAKEALGLFKRMGADAEKIVAEGADWKTGAETRKFIRTAIRDSQGGYRYDQVPLWANSATGRFFYQFGRWGTQRARNIWKNGIQPLIGEEVQWNGKTMVRRDAGPLIKMGIGAAALGEAYALIAQGFFGRDRKDASIQEISEALDEDQKQAALLAGERLINDVIMSGGLGIFGQPLDFAKSVKDQSRFKNPAEPPALASTKAVITLAQNALDQEGRVTNKDLMAFIGGIAPGGKQLYDVGRNIFDEPLFEAENDVRTLRTAATRWAAANKLDVPKRSTGDFRKSANAPEYEELHAALLVGNADRAKVLASQFVQGEKDRSKASAALKASVKGRQPFRVGPFTNGEYRGEFMKWAASHLPKKDFEQAKRVQDRYEAAAKRAGLW